MRTLPPLAPLVGCAATLSRRDGVRFVTRSALALLLAVACAPPPPVPPAATAPPATPASAITPAAGRTALAPAGVPGGTTRVSGPTGPASGGAAAPSGGGGADAPPPDGGASGAGLDQPAGLQTAVAVAAKPGPKPPPEQPDPRALAAAPEPEAGKPVVLVGQVARVVERGPRRWLELLAQPPGETEIQSVDVLFEGGEAAVQPEGCYRIVGVAAGRDELGRAFTGSTRDVPLVLGTEVAPAPLGPYGIGCAPP